MAGGAFEGAAVLDGAITDSRAFPYGFEAGVCDAVGVLLPHLGAPYSTVDDAAAAELGVGEVAHGWRCGGLGVDAVKGPMAL